MKSESVDKKVVKATNSNAKIIYADNQAFELQEQSQQKSKTEVINKEIESSLNNSTFHYKEGGTGWIIVAACAFCFGINVAMVNIYALIYNEFVRSYNTTTNNVVYAAWIGSASNGIQFFFCSISSFLVDIFNARAIGVIGGLLSFLGLLTSAFVNNLQIYFVTYAFIFGIGQSLLIAAFFSILPHYFSKRLGLANGLMSFFGAAIIVSAPFIVEVCLQKLDLSKTFLVLSAMSFITALCCLTFKPMLPKEHSNLPFKKNFINSMALDIFKSKRFIVWAIASFLGFLGYLIPIITMSHFVEINFPGESQALPLALLGAFSGTSSIVFGKLSDYLKISYIYYHMASFFVAGLIQILIPFATKYLYICVLFALYGINDGLFLCFIVPISCETAKSHKKATQAVGYFYASIALPVIVGPTVAGAIFEAFAKYDYAFYMGGSLSFLSSLVILLFYPDSFLVEWIKKLRRRNAIYVF